MRVCTGDADRLFSRRLPAGHRRIPRDRAADRWHVRGDMSRKATSSTTASASVVGRRQPAPDLGRVRRPHRTDGVPLGAGPASWASPTASSSAGHPARPVCSTRRSWSKPTKGQIDDLVHGSVNAPARRAGAGHHAHEEDGRGPHRLPPRAGDPGPLPAFGSRHSAPRRTAAAIATGEYDVLVGINLLREGLDLPEVSLWRFSTPIRKGSCAARPR